MIVGVPIGQAHISIAIPAAMGKKALSIWISTINEFAEMDTARREY